MNKTLIVIGGILILGITGYALFLSNNSVNSTSTLKDTEENITVSSSDEPTEFENGLSSLQALIERGENLSCDFRHADREGTESTGTIFVAGESFRIDSSMTDSEQKTYESSMIFQDEIFHAWTKSEDGESFGFTFAATKNDVIENTDDTVMTGGSVSLDQEVDFTCRKWSVDQSVFVPPSDIEFFDPSAMFMPQ